MSRITPGPWKVHGRDTRGLPHSLVGGETLIAKVYSKCYGDVEQENANATLIAAAPDIFLALVESRQVIATALKVGAPDWFDSDEKVSQHTTVKKIDAAIAKATA